jgi:mannose-6-phosphate isomerase-like protein (cupin superfamily)
MVSATHITLKGLIVKTVSIPSDFQHISPAGAEVRVLMSNEHGGIAHCTLRQGIISKAVKHKTVSEFWHVLSGHGQIWRKQGATEIITPLNAGITIDIPLGTEFQYRSDQEDLVFVCVTTPPWSGSDEASYVERGAWVPTC